MKILDYIKSLLPNFAKATVLEDIRVNRLCLSWVTMPAYQEALHAFGGRKFANASLQKDWDVYRRTVKSAQGANLVMAIDKAFPQMLSTLELTEQIVERDYNEDISGVGVTYYKAAVLQMIEAIGFAIEFANKYLNYIYVLECAELSDEEAGNLIETVSASIVPAEVRFLQDRFLDFCTVMDTLSKSTDRIKADFEAIPDITVTQAGDRAVQQTMGATKLDPFKFGFVPLIMNPIYHFRMRQAEYQHHRYERNKLEREQLALRKLKLERLAKGKGDAALDKQIEYTQGRIENLDAAIRKVEDQYA